MTIWDLLAACRRRWPLLLIGLLLTTGTAVWVKEQPGVYWAQSDMIFLAPTSSRFPNSLNTSSESLINMAGLVQSEISDGLSLEATSSSSVSLVDVGVDDGTMIRLPNIGGQWAYNFAQPVLDVQAAADTPEEVARRMASLEQQVQTTLSARQDAAGVDNFNRITIQMSPSGVDVEYREGDRRRALAITLLLGMVLTLAAVVRADRGRLSFRGVYLNAGRHSSIERDLDRSKIPTDRVGAVRGVRPSQTPPPRVNRRSARL